MVKCISKINGVIYIKGVLFFSSNFVVLQY